MRAKNYRKGRFYSIEVLPIYDTLYDALRDTKHGKGGKLGEKVDVLFSQFVYLRDKVNYNKATKREYDNLHAIEKLLEKYGTRENLKRINRLTV